MPQYIKSHSNYVLKKKHQEVNNGDIYERDITTIGGLNQFAPGQIPIYKSGNFIITVGNKDTSSRSIINERWEESTSGEVWTMDTIDTSTSSNDIENDLKIVLKQDYYDLSDFAYFGSCSELIRASLTDILARFPGELAPAIESENPLQAAVAYYADSIIGVGDRSTTLEFGQYVKRKDNKIGNPADVDKDGEYITGVTSNGEIVVEVDEEGNTNLHVIDNPFGINIYNTNLPTKKTSENPLRYFCNEGYRNFTLKVDEEIDPNCPESGYTITKNGWHCHPVVEGYPYPDYNLGWEQKDIEYDNWPQVTFAKIDSRDSLEEFVKRPEVSPYIPEYIEKDSLNAELPFSMPYDEVKGYFDEIIKGDIPPEYKESKEKIKEYVESEIRNKVQKRLDKIKGNFDSTINKNNTFEFTISPLAGHSELNWSKTNTNTLEFGGQNYSATGYARVRPIVWCPGNRVAVVEIYLDEDFEKFYLEKYNEKGPLTIQVFCGNNKEPIYLTDKIDRFKGLHIRPSNKAFFEFWDSLDNFEKILLNYKTDPLYNAQFQIIHENNFGYYREIESFEFPKRYGGYNINTSENEFGDYTNRLSTIAAFYDERFCDNLYRSLTHESIKNFDWTYTREYTPGDEHPYVEGGNKIQKTLRLFGREFDEIKSYIDNINNTNTVTYDEKSNLPDYFLTDVLELDGWDLRVVTPLMLSQYYKQKDGTNHILTESEEEDQANSIDDVVSNKYKGNILHRAFSQDTLRMVTPYSKANDCYPDGYYFACVNEDCYRGSETHRMKYIKATGATYYDDCANVIRERIRNYSSEEEYTMYDVNNEFMKRLKLNSRYILRHKGTIDGIEMLMGMFGFRSKRWFDALPDDEKKKYGVWSEEEKKKYEALSDEEKKEYGYGLPAISECDTTLADSGFSPYDFELIEYSSFTKRIEETWNAPHDMYNIDWINSTKLLTYTYSSNEGDVGYLPYQGLPVAYRNDYYKHCKCPNNGKTYIDNDGNYVPVRYLYPKFDAEEEYDGNPYFQMKGGWISRYIESGSERTNIMFDNENNIISNKGRNTSIHTETVRNIKTVETLKALLDTPSIDLTPNDIYYVKDLSTPYAIIDGNIYPIEYDENNKKYINLTVESKRISIGGANFDSDERITVYNSNLEATSYAIEDKEDGYELQAYIDTDNTPMFIASGRTGLGISSFSLFENGRIYTGKEVDDKKQYTHYFKISDIYQSRHMSDNVTPDGWKQLAETDADYHRVNSIKDYYKGNNPHSGNQSYDNGHEYFLYFKELFKYAYEDKQFDPRCYEGDIPYDDISKIGFRGLVDNDVSNVNYDNNLIADNKVHYFGNYMKSNVKISKEKPYERNIENIERYIYAYDDKRDKSFDEDLRGNYAKRYGLVEKNKKDLTKEDLSGVPGYNLSTEEYMIDGFSGYTKDSVDKIPYIDTNTPIDASTNQIVNNKRLKMKIYLRNKNWASNDGLCELKYLDEIVIPYITQMIPSSTIFEVQYVERN